MVLIFNITEITDSIQSATDKSFSIMDSAKSILCLFQQALSHSLPSLSKGHNTHLPGYLGTLLWWWQKVQTMQAWDRSGLKTQNAEFPCWLSQPRCQDVMNKVGVSVEHLQAFYF